MRKRRSEKVGRVWKIVHVVLGARESTSSVGLEEVWKIARVVLDARAPTDSIVCVAGSVTKLPARQ